MERRDKEMPANEMKYITYLIYIGLDMYWTQTQRNQPNISTIDLFQPTRRFSRYYYKQTSLKSPNLLSSHTDLKSNTESRTKLYRDEQ